VLTHVVLHNVYITTSAYIISRGHKIDVFEVWVISPTTFPIRVIGCGEFGEVIGGPSIDGKNEHEEDKNGQQDTTKCICTTSFTIYVDQRLLSIGPSAYSTAISNKIYFIA
jgi:hypothetical protein